MSNIKRSHSAAFKAQVALDALKEDLTQSQLTSKHSVHPTQITNWKRQAIDAVRSCFSKRREREAEEQVRAAEGQEPEIDFVSV